MRDTLVHDLLLGTQLASAHLGQHVPLVHHVSPQAAFALDTALLVGQGHAVTGYALDQMTRFEARLHLREDHELAALPGSHP